MSLIPRLPPVFPLRAPLHNEIHARAPEGMAAPLALSHRVMLCDAAGHGKLHASMKDA
jgi:hypothetical protein